MRITFLECGASPRPTGGARVLYEHANRLVARGHAVSVVHPVYPESRPGFLAGLKQGGRHKRWARTGEWSPRAWMDVDRQRALAQMLHGGLPGARRAAAARLGKAALAERCGV